MNLFLGNFEARIDAKGRVFVPASFRKILELQKEEFLVLRKDVFQECLVLYPGTIWNEEIKILRNKLNKWDKLEQQVFRQFVLDAERIEVDASGRILIPKRYLIMIEVDVRVRFLGMDNTIEIWASDRLENQLIIPEDFASEIERKLKQV